MIELKRLMPGEMDAHADSLAALLVDAVEGGASVTFMPGLTHDKARAYWLAQAGAGDGRAMIVATDDEGVCGFVQVIPVGMENQPHRAEISKLLVHRRARRQGLAERLMREAEAAARDMGKSVLNLDTAKGDDAERLYARLGWVRAGEIPDFAYDPAGRLRTTVLFWKRV
jgi:ribosomal protein S18 acetylase RimI-like enzyme